MSSGLQMQLLDINSLGAGEMTKALKEVQEAAEKRPEIAQATTLYQGLTPQYQVKVDRDRVELQGVDIESVYSILSAYPGGGYVNDFVKFGRTFQVTVQGRRLPVCVPTT